MEHGSAQIFRVGNALIDHFLYTDWDRVVFWLKIFSFALSFAMIWGVVVILKRHRHILLDALEKRSNVAAGASRKNKEREEWKNIVERWHSEASSDKRLALIEADAFLDSVLKDRGIEGETVAERLENPALTFSIPRKELLFAHVFRNELVHDVGSTFDPVDGERAFRAYTQALTDLEVI